MKEIKIWHLSWLIIDIDWYENNYCDNFLGHIAQPYSEVRAKLVPPNGTYPTRQDTRLGSWEWDEIRFLETNSSMKYREQ